VIQRRHDQHHARKLTLQTQREKRRIVIYAHLKPKHQISTSENSLVCVNTPSHATICVVLCSRLPIHPLIDSIQSICRTPQPSINKNAHIPNQTLEAVQLKPIHLPFHIIFLYKSSVRCRRRRSLLREHSGDLLFGQDDVLHGILLAFEILRFVVCVGGEEELCCGR
jgi:hypothetical protein